MTTQTDLQAYAMTPDQFHKQVEGLLQRGHSLKRAIDEVLYTYNKNTRAAQPKPNHADAAHMLEVLFTMVNGECPSLLEDHHIYPKIVSILEAARLQLSVQSPKVIVGCLGCGNRAEDCKCPPMTIHYSQIQPPVDAQELGVRIKSCNEDIERITNISTIQLPKRTQTAELEAATIKYLKETPNWERQTAKELASNILQAARLQLSVQSDETPADISRACTVSGSATRKDAVVGVSSDCTQPPVDAQELDGWLPIDKCNPGFEGKRFLLWWPYVTKEHPIIGYFGMTDSGKEKWMGNEVLGLENDPGPTHWMPLLAPPKSQSLEG